MEFEKWRKEQSLIIKELIEASKMAECRITANELYTRNFVLPTPKTATNSYEIKDFKVVVSEENKEPFAINIVSIMTFADGTQTKAIVDKSDYDPYYGFIICFCKKVMGKDFHKVVDYWMSKPEREAKEALEKEQKAIAERNAMAAKKAKAEKEKYKRLVRQKELEIRAEQEARHKISKKKKLIN